MDLFKKIDNLHFNLKNNHPIKYWIIEMSIDLIRAKILKPIKKLYR